MCIRARTRACIRWRLSLQEQRCGEQRPAEQWRGAVRVKGGCSEMMMERKKQEVADACVVGSLRSYS